MKKEKFFVRVTVSKLLKVVDNVSEYDIVSQNVIVSVADSHEKARQYLSENGFTFDVELGIFVTYVKRDGVEHVLEAQIEVV